MAGHCVIVEDDPGIQTLLSHILASVGLTSTACHDTPAMVAVIAGMRPQIIFLDVALNGSDAIASFHELVTAAFDGPVQLISGCAPDILAAVHRRGKEQGLHMLPPLAKPFRSSAIQRILVDAGLIGEIPAGNTPRGRNEPPPAQASVLCRSWRSLQTGAPVHVEATLQAVGFDEADVSTSENAKRHLDVFRHCLSQAAAIESQLTPARLPVSVVLPSKLRYWRSVNIASQFSHACGDSQRADLIVLEFTEDDVFEDLAAARDMLIQLRIRNVRLRLSHAGTRFLSMAGYDKLPVQEVMMHPRLLELHGEERAQRTLVKIVEIAKRTDALVLAGPTGGHADRQRLRQAGFDWCLDWPSDCPRPLDEFVRAACPDEPRRVSSIWDVLPDFGKPDEFC